MQDLEKVATQVMGVPVLGQPLEERTTTDDNTGNKKECGIKHLNTTYNNFENTVLKDICKILFVCISSYVRE